MVFLHGHGVGTARAVRIFETYGIDAVQVMTENPYRLARDVRGIGFKTADAIARKLGIEMTAMIRVRAGIAYALGEAMDDGHCGLPEAELVPLAAELLEAPEDLVHTTLDLELADSAVVAATVAGTACVFLAGLYRAERVIAERIRRLAEGRPPWPNIHPVQGPALGRAVHRPVTDRKPGRRRSPGSDVEGHGDNRRSRGRQDHPSQRHPAHPLGQGGWRGTGDADRPGRQKVMQTENDYDKEGYNGDVGYVKDVDLEAGELSASFDGRTVVYGFGELDALVPAYATTVHKSQGSEYPAVVLPVLTQHYAMLQRNLLYTGVTRGKRLVVLGGQKRAVAIAVRNVSGRRRWSRLAEWLGAAEDETAGRHQGDPQPC